MESLERLIRAIEIEFGTTATWIPVIEAAKRELSTLSRRFTLTRQ
jgi:hypothetical protein